jgi:hypothetical protein
MAREPLPGRFPFTPRRASLWAAPEPLAKEQKSNVSLILEHNLYKIIASLRRDLPPRDSLVFAHKERMVYFATTQPKKG